MKTVEIVLEDIAGFILGLLSLLILFVGSIFAVGSVSRYLKAKSM
jgi:hypothetical protein